MAAIREETALEDAADVRICGIFVVAVVTGTVCFYWNVLCCAVQLVR